ncbi:unnamed protein product [Mytilus coruscus]|uniref:EGF-like domain-containing protein n=1 Tax=Mytilus coruscus TaxID=42192 RepID=A0A6J8ENF7_MYTCO|nr:unnamed protein product [Mytilus coruscus]
MHCRSIFRQTITILDIGHVDIGFNTFYNSCLIYLKTWNNANLSFHDNTIEYGNCEGLGKCHLEAYAKGNKEIKGRMFNISTNIFTDLVSDCIVGLVSSDDAGVFPGVFYYNKFLTTQATVGTVTLDSKCFNFSHNIFDNPKSPYDLYVKKKAYERIFDFHRDSNLLLVNITSILTDRNIDCSGVNNCSSNGECVSPKNVDVSLVMLVKCAQDMTVQGNVNNCSDHGFCIRPDICTCASSFTGENCGLCMPSHWGTNCDPCPNCRNGECNLNTGTCDCFGAQWTGRLCDICSETFYGPDCLPLLTVLNVIPNQGFDRGGNDVHVWGHNFPQTDTYKCKFDTDVVNGVWVASNHVVCSVPKHADGTVSLEISSDGIEFSNNQVKYSYFATCPPNSCGRDVSPPRGQCLFGGCSCNLPWTGENCTTELLAPEIIEPPPQTINESVMYDYQLQLARGSIPVTWSLIYHPGNMIIDKRTGRLFWSNVIGRLLAYSVTVTATNIVGEHSIEWTINVPVSYSVNLLSLDPDGILSKPKQIDIVGEVAFSDLIAPRLVPIKLVIKSTLTGTERVLSPSNENYDPTLFRTTYYPRPDDAGTFTVEAYHPGLEQSTGNALTWEVLGMRCEPTFVSLKSYIDDSQTVFANVSTLKNVGGYPISNISAQVYGIQNVHVFKSEDKMEEQFFLAELLADGMISFGLQIKDVKPMSETFYIVFSTMKRTYARLQINIDLSIKKPLLILEPFAVKESIIRGTQNIFDVTIRNIGEIPARDVTIHIPDKSKITLMTLSKKGEDMNYANEQMRDSLTIPTLSEAIMSLAVTVESNTPLGELRGTIAVNTNLTTFSLPYTITITSERQFNLTFVIKDEYTYFATGAPLVVGAEVKLVNQDEATQKHDSHTMIQVFNLPNSNCRTVLFENIYEDKYTVYAKAEGHSTYSAIIIATPYTTVRDIFLQRRAVIYTWTVTPTTVEDKYKITLDSTFETFVPMPVVTIEPNKLDTVPFETEERDCVDFTITNHGLIRADNLRFFLPTGHPTLQFKSVNISPYFFL